MERGPLPKTVTPGEGVTPSTLGDVIDVSNYSGVVTDVQAEAIKVAGVVGVIVRIDTLNPERISIMQQQLAMFRSHGVPVEGYVFPDYDQGVEAFITDVFSLAGPLRSLWIDLEPVSDVMPTSFAIFRWWMGQASLYCPSTTKLGVYTAEWVVAKLPAWQPLSYPLWAAAYGDKPTTLDVSFGGWSQAAGIQYSDKGNIAGVSCDMSIFCTEYV